MMNMKNAEKAVTVLSDKVQVHSALLDDIKDAVIEHQNALLEHMAKTKIIIGDEFECINNFLKYSGENGRIPFSDIFIDK